MSLQSDLKKHQTRVEHLAGGQRKLVEEELAQLRRLASIEIVSGTQGTQLKQNIRALADQFAERATSNLLSIAEKEQKYTAKILKKHLGVKVEPKDISNTLLNENMRLQLASQEKTRKSLSTAYKQFSRRKADEIVRVIRDGQIQGLDTVDIMKNVDETIMGRHTAQARVLANTSTLYTSNVAQRTTIEQTGRKVRFTLGDSSEHTETCLGLEGKIFDSSDAPTPPLHWGCNSFLVPIDED